MLSTIAPDFTRLLLDSHARIVGTPLVPEKLSLQEAACWLYDIAPFCLLAHDATEDPCFVYANLAAQRCFEYSWDELVGMPSRLTAEPPNREERQHLLKTVARDGFATGYRGLRIAKSGRCFWIENVTVWNLMDNKGFIHGQAATYQNWHDV